jgi:2-polyprenyl-3-methyl-5-hydroxy-6-metoxy-1,4-benzoquinol methylase
MDTSITNQYTLKSDSYSSHSIIYSMLDHFPAGTRILEVGTSSGFIGRLCQKKDFIFLGIEPDQNAADEAQPYYQKIYKQSIEQIPDEHLKDYEVVILGDVLEHLLDPELILTRLVSLQPPGGCFIISIPNIANVWVRMNLLFGRFDYQDKGILDKTHLHFFTLKSIRALISRSGLQIQQVKSTPIPLPLLNHWFISSFLGSQIFSLLHLVTTIFPTLFGYQFVIKAEKPNNESE